MEMAQVQLEQGSRCLGLPSLLSSGDVEGASSCLARHVCLLTPDATAVHGREGVRQVFAQLIASKIRIEVEASRVLVVDDTALSRERWGVTSSGIAGSRGTGVLCPTFSLQRIEGTWKVAILVLWGWGDSLGS